MISDDVRLSPMIRGDARSLRLPGRFGTVCRAASGPTLGLNCAAGECGDRHSYRHETNTIKCTEFRAAPAASIAGHVGPPINSNNQGILLQFNMFIYRIDIYMSKK